MLKKRFSNNFTKLILASGFSNLADGIGTVVWAWLATLITRDPLYVALVPVAVRLPWFLFAIPAGIVVDRLDRKPIVLVMDGLRVVSFALIAAMIWLVTPLETPPESGLEHPGLYVAVLSAAILVGFAEVFRDSAAQTLVPSMVPEDELEKANGRLWSVELTGNSLAGPAIGTFLIAAAPFLPFATNAVSYGVAALLILRISGRYQPNARKKRNWKQELKDGLEFLKQSPSLQLLAVVTGVWNLLFQMVFIALFLHAQENIGIDATYFGLVIAAGAVGGILGGLCGDRIIRAFGPGKTAAWMLFASAPAFLAISVAPNALMLGVVLFVFEFSGLVWNTVSVSYRQRSIPNELLGRVSSLYRLLAWGMMPIGLLLSGVIVKVADNKLDRDLALIMPFLIASAGALLLSALASRPLVRAFSRT